MSSKSNTRSVIKDPITGREAEVIQRSDGKNALATDARVVVESTFGFDPLPDSYFEIINTGSTGDTLTINIAGTNADPSVPDSDVPSYTKIFTVQAGEQGDELKFRDRIVSELNLDTTFRQTVFLRAFSPSDRPIVHISSEKFSLSGEFWERPNVGDFDVSVTGSCQVNIGFDNLTSRSKPISISRDPDSPHNLGVFGISGSVSVQSKDLADLFIQYATDDGTPIPERGGTGDQNMLVDGSVTPKEFFVPAQANTDIFIQTMRFKLQGNGIKINNFGAKSGAGGLTNGILVEIKSDNIVTQFPLLRTTSDFKNDWAALSGTMGTWNREQEAGADEFTAVVSFENPFVIKLKDTFGVGNDDYIKVIISDDITTGNAKFDFLVRGFEKEP